MEGLAIVGIIQSKGGRSVAVDGSALQAFDVDNSVQTSLNAILFPLGRRRRIRGRGDVTGMTGQGQVHNLVLVVHLVHFGNASALGDFHIGGNSGGHLFQGDGPSVVLLVVGAHVIALGVHNCQLKGSGVAVHGEVGSGNVLAAGGNFLMADAIGAQCPQLVGSRQVSNQLNNCLCAQVSNLNCGAALRQVHSIPVYGDIPQIQTTGSLFGRSAERNHCDDQHERQKHRK